jgi:toxin-antitoxin system PIN domain toxin
VIVIDANLLLYAYDRNSPFHKAAAAWFARVLSDDDLVGLPWQSVAAFLRVATNPKLASGLTASHVPEIVASWLDQPNVRLLSPGERHWPLLREMIRDGQAYGPLVSDAQLAALTIEHGGVLQTTDRDFTRFPGLRWTNPLLSLRR